MISILLCLRLSGAAQERETYNIGIETSRWRVTGVCAVLYGRDSVSACVFNEFGLTVLDFTYFPERGKVKLDGLTPFLDKWYIRKVIRKDLARLMRSLPAEKAGYTDSRRGITYKLERIECDETQGQSL